MSDNSRFRINTHYLSISLYVLFTAIALLAAYRIISNIGAILSAAAALAGNVAAALSPLFIGLVIAYLLDPLARFIVRQISGRLPALPGVEPAKAAKRSKMLHAAGILLTFALILAAAGLIIYTVAVMIVGQLVFASLDQMIQSIVDYFLKYEQALRDLIAKIPGSGLEERLQEVVATLAVWLSDNFSTESVMRFIIGIGGGILNVILGIVVSVYLLLDADLFRRMGHRALSLVLPQARMEQLYDAGREINLVIGRFLRGQLLDGLIVAILASIALTMVGLDFSVFIGFFAGLANIIPYFGPILGMIPAVIVALLSGSPTQALLAVVVLLVIQQIDGAIISPRVVGASTGLHPVAVLSAVLFGGYFWGIPGMLLAVPAAAILKLFLVRRFGAR